MAEEKASVLEYLNEKVLTARTSYIAMKGAKSYTPDQAKEYIMDSIGNYIETCTYNEPKPLISRKMSGEWSKLAARRNVMAAKQLVQATWDPDYGTMMDGLYLIDNLIKSLADIASNLSIGNCLGDLLTATSSSAYVYAAVEFFWDEHSGHPFFLKIILENSVISLIDVGEHYVLTPLILYQSFYLRHMEWFLDESLSELYEILQIVSLITDHVDYVVQGKYAMEYKWMVETNKEINFPTDAYRSILQQLWNLTQCGDARYIPHSMVERYHLLRWLRQLMAKNPNITKKRCIVNENEFKVCDSYLSLARLGDYLAAAVDYCDAPMALIELLEGLCLCRFGTNSNEMTIYTMREDEHVYDPSVEYRSVSLGMCGITGRSKLMSGDPTTLSDVVDKGKKRTNSF